VTGRRNLGGREHWKQPVFASASCAAILQVSSLRRRHEPPRACRRRERDQGHGVPDGQAVRRTCGRGPGLAPIVGIPDPVIFEEIDDMPVESDSGREFPVG